MDRNTVIGFSLIFLILAGYYWYTAPSPEELARMQNMRDSVALVEKQTQDSLARIAAQKANTTEESLKDSTLSVPVKSEELSAFEKGNDTLIVL